MKGSQMTGQILKEIRRFNRISQADYAEFCGYSNRSSIYRLEQMEVVPIRYFSLLGQMIGTNMTTENEILSIYHSMKRIEDADIRDSVTIEWAKVFNQTNQHHTYYSLMDTVFQIYGEFSPQEYYVQFESALQKGILREFSIRGSSKYILNE
jgi:transcriptional regulator with XRE-family HTH domain